ncbi:MAG: RNA methyltransferase, partial [Candidatus Puniceispirillaceae bacterium]
MMTLPPAPIVILARPQMGENIGAAARAMMNCGLSELRLVAPRDGWPNPAALPMAAGGSQIIENARVFDSLAAAAHDVSLMLAASARRRDLPIKSADPRAAAAMMLAHERNNATHPDQSPTGRTAMLFGPEASGLDNDEVVLADVLVTAPLNPSYPSL